MTDGEFVEIRIDWEPDKKKAQFANHLLVNFDGAVYTLRFFQVLPPTVLAPEQAREIESVPGRHVASMVVAKETLPGFIEVLKQMADRVGEQGATEES